jgi:hypothetical protein
MAASILYLVNPAEGQNVPKTLTARLQELVKFGFMVRKSYNEIPPRVDYELTQKGRDLERCSTNCRPGRENTTMSNSPEKARKKRKRRYDRVFFKNPTVRVDIKPFAGLSSILGGRSLILP